MPTLQAILDDMRVRVPNSFTDAQLIGWLNEGMRKLYKFMNDTKTSTFVTIANTKNYLLPTDCIIDQIIEIDITTDTTVTNDSKFTPYTYKGLQEELDGNNFYDMYDGQFGLSPIPDTDNQVGVIYYRNKPALLTSGDMGAIPEINEDYQDTIKYYALSIVAHAGRAPNISLANTYKILYNDMIDMLFKDRMEKQVRNPKKTRANKWW